MSTTTKTCWNNIRVWTIAQSNLSQRGTYILKVAAFLNSPHQKGWKHCHVAKVYFHLLVIAQDSECRSETGPTRGPQTEGCDGDETHGQNRFSASWRPDVWRHISLQFISLFVRFMAAFLPRIIYIKQYNTIILQSATKNKTVRNHPLQVT